MGLVGRSPLDMLRLARLLDIPSIDGQTDSRIQVWNSGERTWLKFGTISI